MFCTNCGQSNDDTAKFCINCGNRLVPESGPAYERAQEPQSWECSFCRSLNDADCVFCTYCGQRRHIVDDAEEPDTAGEWATSPSEYAQLEAVASSPEPGVQSRKGKYGLVAAVVVVALIVGGGLLWYRHSGNGVHDASETTETADSSDSVKREKAQKKESKKETKSSSSDFVKKKTLDRKTMDALVNPYDTSSDSVAVSVMTSDKTVSYSSEHAYLSMSSAGLYLPPMARLLR